MIAIEYKIAAFSPGAKWTWDDSDPSAYHYYLQARRRVELIDDDWQQAQCGAPCTLSITADAMYQVRLNGQVIGHGPAKSAAGRRSVDTYDITISRRRRWL